MCVYLGVPVDGDDPATLSRAGTALGVSVRVRLGGQVVEHGFANLRHAHHGVSHRRDEVRVASACIESNHAGAPSP